MNKTPAPKTHSHADLKAIAIRTMRERGLLPEFSSAELNESNSIKAAASDESPAVRDMRKLLWCSIDNDESLDLDQLSVAEALPGGAVKIFVAIADVDSLVPKASLIDGHASHNTTSVYTPVEVFPMLPARLSTDLTTLREEVERLALIVEMTLQPDGALDGSDVYRATVVNHAKLAYNSLADWLDGKGPAPQRLAKVPGLGENIRLQDRVAQSLRARRQERGALSLETIESTAVFDGAAISDLKVMRKNRAKDLIEDLMIAANGVTARFLESRKLPSLRRVLRSPERWQRIVELAAGLKEQLPAAPDARALNLFLLKRKQIDPLRFADLSLAVVKLIGKGEYVLEIPGQNPDGHFGLAVRDYTHSTAPNRRFPDLITQRLLKATLAARPQPYSNEELAALAGHCTERENAAEKVERQVRKSAAALLLESRIGECFDAIVTGINEHGTWIRTLHPPVEGKLEPGARAPDVGDSIKAQLVSVNVDRGFIDFKQVK